MFHVKLVDIDNDRQCVDYDSPLDTLAEVEKAIVCLITTVTKKSGIILVHDGGLLYQVFAGGYNIGTVYIKSI